MEQERKAARARRVGAPLRGRCLVGCSLEAELCRLPTSLTAESCKGPYPAAPPLHCPLAEDGDAVSSSPASAPTRCGSRNSRPIARRDHLIAKRNPARQEAHPPLLAQPLRVPRPLQRWGCPVAIALVLASPSVSLGPLGSPRTARRAGRR